MLDNRKNLPVSLSPFSFLVVDDSPSMRAIIATVLRSYGARRLFECDNGPAALNELAANPLDFLIIDYAMPGMDGVEVARHLRRTRESASNMAPIILMTAHTDRRRIEAARDAGVNEILMKPVSPKALVERIAFIIEHPRRYIRAPDYIGPDRRRRNDPKLASARRRREDIVDDVVMELD